MKRKVFYVVKKRGYWWIEKRNRWQKNISRKYVSLSSRRFDSKEEAFAHGYRLKGKVTVIEFMRAKKKGWDILVWESKES